MNELRCEGCGSPDRLFRITIKPVKGGGVASKLGVACWACVAAMSEVILECEAERNRS